MQKYFNGSIDLFISYGQRDLFLKEAIVSRFRKDKIIGNYENISVDIRPYKEDPIDDSRSCYIEGASYVIAILSDKLIATSDFRIVYEEIKEALIQDKKCYALIGNNEKAIYNIHSGFMRELLNEMEVIKFSSDDDFESMEKAIEEVYQKIIFDFQNKMRTSDLNDYQNAETLEEKKIINALTLIRPDRGIKKDILLKVLKITDPQILKNLEDKGLVLEDENDDECVCLKEHFADTIFEEIKFQKDLDYLNDIINYLEDNFDSCYTLTEPSSVLGYNRYYLVDYLKERRFEIFDNVMVYARILIKLAKYENFSNMPKKALDDLKLALNVVEKSDIDKDSNSYKCFLVDFNNNMGVAHHTFHNKEESLKYFLKAYNIFKEIPLDDLDITNFVNLFVNLSTYYLDKKQYLEALKYSKEGLSYYKNKEKDFNYALLAHQIGTIYANIKLNDEAFKYLTDAYDLFIKYYKKNPSEARQKIFTTGLLLIDIKYYQEANECLNRYYKILKRVRGEDGEHYCLLYSKLSLTSNTLGQYEKALDWCKLALKVDRIRESHKREIHFEIYGQMGLAYFHLGNFEEAKKCYDMAYNINQLAYHFFAPATKEEAEFFANRAENEHALANYNDEIDNLRKAIDMYDYTLNYEANYKIIEIELYQKMGEAYRKIGDLKGACYSFFKALEESSYLYVKTNDKVFHLYDETIKADHDLIDDAIANNDKEGYLDEYIYYYVELNEKLAKCKADQEENLKDVYLEVAGIYQKLNMIDEAKEYQDKANKIKK